MNQKTEALTQDDISRLLHASEGNCDLHDAIQMVAATGLRARELERLRWKDVNFATATISVQGKSGERLLKMNAATEQALRARLERQFVFTWRVRSVLGRLNHQLRAIAATLGLEVHTLRALRTALAISLLRLRVPVSMDGKTNPPNNDGPKS